MLEKGATGCRQLDPASAARKQLNANLSLEIADLPTERGLSRVQSLLGCRRKATRLGGGNKITKLPKLHAAGPALQVCPNNLQSLTQMRQANLRVLP